MKLPLLLILSLLCFVACGTSPENRTDEPEVLKEVDRKGISQTMFRHRKHVSNCYGQALTKKGQEKLKGKIMMQFNIGQDGRARAVQALDKESTIQNSDLKDCIVKGLESWEFPIHPRGEVITVKYPLVFSDAPPSSMQNTLDRFEKLKKTE